MVSYEVFTFIYGFLYVVYDAGLYGLFREKSFLICYIKSNGFYDLVYGLSTFIGDCFSEMGAMKL
jgi:hypothetical protein